jgi:hypothetical protein
VRYAVEVARLPSCFCRPGKLDVGNAAKCNESASRKGEHSTLHLSGYGANAWIENWQFNSLVNWICAVMYGDPCR